jgi:hypothetical protein
VELEVVDAACCLQPGATPVFHEKSSSRHGPWQGIFPSKLPEIAVFETCNMLLPYLEMYSSAPIKDVGRAGLTAVDD